MAGVSGVRGYLTYQEDRQLLEQEQFLLGEHLARSGAVSCLEPLLGRDYPAIDTFVEDLVGQAGAVVEVCIYRAGEVIAEARRPGSSGAEVSVHRAPIEMHLAGRGPEQLGSLELKLSKEHTTAALAGQAWQTLILSLASFGLLVGILASVLRRQLGRPLEVLDARTRELSLGEFERPVPQVGAAELGRLAGTLEHMRLSVRAAHRGLEERNDELELAVEAKDTALVELQEALVRAQAAERARAEFLANMSHELCTPLNGILGLTDILLGDSTGEDSQDHLECVQRSGLEMLRLVRGVLDWSAIENGAVQLEQSPFHAETLLREQVAAIEPAAREKGLSLRIEVATHWNPVRKGDGLRVEQVMGELLDNAVKFTDQGEIVCRLGPDEGREGLRLQVLDTGPGPGAQGCAPWFEAFVQADGSTTRSHGGAGLGLSIASRLAQLMGGELCGSARAQGGTAMTLNLPLPTAPPRKGEADASGPQALHVLVVDDNSVNRKLASAVVAQGGHTSALACDGVQALEQVRDNHFDVILMDVQMPNMDGFEATRQIRHLENERGSQRVPILALTAGAFEGGATTCHEAGMDGYLAKPVSSERLLSSVEAYAPQG